MATGASKLEALRQVLAEAPLPPNQIPAPKRLVLCDRVAYPYSSSAGR